MSPDAMQAKWQELLKRGDVVGRSTFVKYKPFNIRKVYPHIARRSSTLICVFKERFSILCLSDMSRVLRVEEVLSSSASDAASPVCALSDCDGCSEDCAHCAADATCAAERHATSDQRAAIERFVEAKAAFEPHRALYKHQDEQYRAMKDNLGHEKAMVVFDFSPYNATQLEGARRERAFAVRTSMLNLQMHSFDVTLKMECSEV
jgi:hypothetical protein